MKILFICTHNRCRSILAEAIANHFGGDDIVARSAGSQPVGEVHPLSLKYLKEQGVSTEGLTSQSWDEHESWQPDVVITVCDSAAGESCPVWFGHSIKVHWGLADPSKLSGSDDDIANAFRNTMAILKNRIQRLSEVNTENKSKQEIADLLIEIENID